MNALNHASYSVPSENWDDDFEFQQSINHNHNRKANNFSRFNATPQDATRVSFSSSRFSEDWDVDHESPKSHKKSSSSVLEDKMNLPTSKPSTTRPQFSDWVEPGPSTPTKRPMPPPCTENWDDDFEDRTDSPIRKNLSRSPESARRYHGTPSRVRRYHHTSASGTESCWDDDLDSNKPENHSPSKRQRQDSFYPSSSDDDVELGDQTVTSRLRPRAAIFNTPPPVPSVPAALSSSGRVESFPRSPDGSVFSIPLSSGTGRESITYSSTSHLALRPTMSDASSALAMLSTPPAHKERRRLRKKSRPPHVDENVFELQERGQSPLPSSSSIPLSTPERDNPSPPPEPSASPPSSRSLLLSRIGSVKKWGARKIRNSTAPSDVVQDGLGNENESAPRPPSSLAQSSPPVKTGGWFFRATGGGGSGSGSPSPKSDLIRTKSTDKLRRRPSPSPNPSDRSMRDGDDEASPDPPAKLSKRKSLGFARLRRRREPVSGDDDDNVQRSSSPTPRRPISMQPNANPRHASYAYGMSASTSTPAPTTGGTATTSTENLGKAGQREGSRGFMGGVRRLSLVGQRKHKRTKSSGATELSPSLPVVLPPPPASAAPTTELFQANINPTAMEESLPLPPRVANGVSVSHSAPAMLSNGIESLLLPELNGPNPGENTDATRSTPVKAPTSPQSASLGRSTSPTVTASVIVPRRNSLGDLKIPSRISQAQVGLRRDLGMVREFAAHVEQLKELQSTFASLAADVQKLLESRQPSRTTSPTFFHLPLPGTRPRSNTNPVPPQKPYKHLASTFEAITSKYRLSWECAELLIELGGGASIVDTPPPTSTSAPVIHSRRSSVDGRKNRERAITLSGDESTPPAILASGPAFNPAPPNLSWRASTGRHDLSHRQLVLLREMLNNAESSFAGDLRIPEESPLNREWRWGDAMSSTVTLPSEESQEAPSKKNRRSSKLGMRGLRDLLRSLKRNNTEPPVPHNAHPPSSVDVTTDSSVDHQARHWYNHPHIVTHRRTKASAGPESMISVKEQRPASPFDETSLKQKSSPRRPSLASIFRMGQKSKSSSLATSTAGDPSADNTPTTTATTVSQSSGLDSSSNGNLEDEDWDRMDSASDLDVAAPTLKGCVDAETDGGSATVRGKSPYPQEDQARHGSVPSKNPSSSQCSISRELPSQDGPPTRFTRLSNVEESVDADSGSRKNKSNAYSHTPPSPSPSRHPSRRRGSGRGSAMNSMRSAPPQQLEYDSKMVNADMDPDVKLAMTPENIRPLLENAREVLERLHSCNGELRLLLAA